MIPLHDSEKTKRNVIVVNHLTQLNEYDFTEAHRHNYFEFFYFLKGGGTHKIDFIDFPIKANSTHIVAPGQVHQMKRELNSEGYVILFDLSALDAPKMIGEFLFRHICLDASEYQPDYVFPDELKQNLETKISLIWKLSQAKSSLDLLSLKHEIQAFCIECMKLNSDQTLTSNSEYLHFRRILKDQFMLLKKVKEYAERMNLSERSLNELVKKQTGQTASEIIYGQIIMEAKRLLNTGISVKETAYNLNFDDPAHFSKFFKTQTGIAPSDFLKNT